MSARWTKPREGVVAAAGGVVSVVVAIALYTRYSINGSLGRDEAIYVYGGQRMSHGTAPYESIFDPKTPLATMISALGALIARLVGRYDLYVIRLGFFACSVLTVLGIYLLARALWHSTVAGLAAAVVFASFDGFAMDALAGPDAKTPGVMCAVFSMWFVTRRDWFWAGVLGALSFLVWQPFGSYSLLAIVAAAVAVDGDRRRDVVRVIAGSALPLIATAVYFWAEGAFGDFFDAAFRFPFEGVQRGNQTVDQRLHRIVFVIHHYYHASGVLFWIGCVLLVLSVVASIVFAIVTHSGWGRALLDPLVIVVFLSGVSQFAYAAHDFQGYPDVFPLLPYGALGFGGAAAATFVLLQRLTSQLWWRAAAAAVLVVAVALTLFSWNHFTDAHNNTHVLKVQRADACALNRVILPGTVMWSLGDPTPLALTHRTNPDRFIYLGSGVDHWKIEHEKGGFAAWQRQIARSHFSVIVINSWFTKYRVRMGNWLKAHYARGYIGPWRVFLSKRAHERIHARGFRMTPGPTTFPRTAARKTFRQHC